MPIHDCSINGNSGFKWGDAGKCYPYVSGSEASKKNAKKKALAQGVAIGDIKFNMLFDDTIPSEVIKSFKDDGYNCFIWAGTSLDTPYKQVHKLCQAANINDTHVKFGELSTIMKRYDIFEFVTSNKEYRGIKGYSEWIGTMNFAAGDVKLGYKVEKWIKADDQSCPICVTLDEMGWVRSNYPVDYIWPTGSKTIMGLPLPRHAHSQIGEGNWSAPDSSCKCFKQYDWRSETFNQVTKVELAACTCKH